MSKDNLNDLLTVRQVSQILSVSERSVREFINTRELRASKVGQWRIPRSAVQNFFDKRNNQYEQKFLREIEQFVRGDRRGAATPSTMVIRDYPCPEPKDLRSIEQEMERVMNSNTDIEWRYSYENENNYARHVFYGDLGAIHDMVKLIDRIYIG